MKIQNMKQQGATLITSLLMLIIMTIVGVSATKVSILNTLIAGNEQNKMILFQQKESELVKQTNPVNLLLPWLKIDGKGFDKNFEYQIMKTTENKISKNISLKDLKKEVACNGVSNLTVEIGAGVPPCRLFDFSIVVKSQLGSAQATGSRGVGKEVPPLNKYVLGN